MHHPHETRSSDALIRKGRRRKLAQKALPYLLLSPTLILILLFLLLPLCYSAYCSLCRCDYMVFTKFLGLENYRAVLKDREIISSIGKAFYISAISLVLAMVTGILIAQWIHAEKNSKKAYFLQLFVLVPWVTSMVVSSMLWKWILQDESGILNYFITRLGGKKIGFLTDPKLAIYTLIAVMTWRVIGYVMIQILAGLKVIPLEYEEAACIDGASKWQLFWKIRIPLLKTPLAISAVIIGLSNLNNLTVPLTLLGGGPGTSTMVVAIKIYRESFTNYHFGEASALSIILCALNFILMVIYVKAVKYEI